ncbi:hypothetical protein UABAM_04282 [Candidatus Uabimicrobium amorphum]|uniref:Uncharacterized protein n=1 Tax=Uabimicrobium amorphum TaxID=2596890 RepID=A0A5S9IQU6_UABAM|nr:hypothetical protein UABAM_04282 [Candidatus Uabimicrobium amorphum]
MNTIDELRKELPEVNKKENDAQVLNGTCASFLLNVHVRQIFLDHFF